MNSRVPLKGTELAHFSIAGQANGARLPVTVRILLEGVVRASAVDQHDRA